MQYVGKLVSTVYNTITPNINPATLSGAIDVIVVEKTIDVEEEVEVDGQGNILSEAEQGKLPEQERKYKTIKRQITELASTPFHVRFGKMSVLRPGERKVTLHLNNSTDPLPFAMKVGDSGEAFFVLEIDDEDERNNIPDDLVTSPILSAASSPMALPEDDGDPDAQNGSAEVEPLMLGEAEQLPAATQAHGDDDPEDPDRNSKAKLKDNKRSGQPDDQGDLNVPSDSTKTGSGAAAGSDSLLDKVGSAASKASGVIGAAGRAVMGGNNPRLDKTAEKAQRTDDTENMTGAPVDEDHNDAHHYEPEQGGPQGKKRQEAQDIAGESSTHNEPSNETEKLEMRLRGKVLEVVEDEVRSENDDESVLSIDSGEEAYPAPFGSGAKVSQKSKTQAVASIHHSEYLDGKRLKPVPIGDGKLTIDPAMTDATTHIHMHKQRQQKRRNSDKLEQDDDDEDTAVDDDEDQDHKNARPDQSSHADDEEDDENIVGAVKVKQRKEDLQYMLDMDGYKMTSDGEDLAYQEGHRFADEMPLGRRHGGKGRHGHSDRLNGPNHQHKVSLPGSSTTAMRRGSGSRSHRPSFSVDYRSNRHSQSRERDARRESLDDTVAANLTKFNSQHSSPHLGAVPMQSGHQDELELSRDLARLARMNRATDNGTGRRQPKGSESLRRHASLTNRNKQPENENPTPGRRRPNRANSRHTHEFSLSDTEAEVPRARSASGHASLENSTEGLTSSYSVSNVVSSLRDLRLPSEEAPPVYLGDTSAAHLGLSSNSRWQWADPAGDSSSSTPTGQPGHRRRTRFTSTDGYEASRSSDASALEALRRHTAEGEIAGKLTSSESEPYTFLLQLEDSSHSFELSLCYSDNFGEDEEADEYVFRENRVSFERFAHDDDVVNDERLVIRYHDRFLTWENASAVLATLSLYRRTLSGSTSATNMDEEADGAERSSRASYWSRWWKRSSKSIPDLKQAADAQGDELGDAKPKKAPIAGANTDAPLERSNTDSVLLDADKADADKLAKEDAPSSKSAAAAAAQRAGKTYAKTLRLTSDQLKSLNLRKGSNSITFSVTSSYSGVATCSARIFLWESNHKIVVSDIDGTITKSDALGHVFTMIGRDWTHIGVAKLYTDIARNGYRIMYLTSRAIGQADSTRDYLKGIRQNGYQLPDGPVIMSPDRLIASLHREVILRKPEVFKMACLRDIARLFGADPRTAQSQPGGDLKNLDSEAVEKAQTGAGVDDSPGAGAATAAPSESTGAQSPTSDATSIRSGRLSPSPSTMSSPTLASLPPLDPQPAKKEEHPTPFYAGFGNRITDALSYRSVNIPSSRIFTIDTNGEVKMELLELAGYKSSYIHMTDLVDQMFPPITAKEQQEPRKPEYNDFNYWRPAIVDIELPDDDELLGTPPVSPALSARSGRSLRSVRSATSDSGVAGEGKGREEEKPGRLSRFGLGSLGLSRKGSQSSTGLAKPEHANTVPPEFIDGGYDRRTRATSAEPALETGMTPSSSTSSWTAPWRRRAASPDDAQQRATSPLVGPVITAEPESEDEGQEEFYDSEGGMNDDDDDVSSFGGGEGESRSRLNSFSLDDDGFDGGRRRVVQGQKRPSEDENDDDDDDDVDDEEEEMMEEEEDELLETGEIRFEWKG
ncbi:related to SMP2 protein, involved in plasmid maintenance, respiration and cell proliferation [Ustilago trichophora]|uniref:phosphatidate phosphatase n=1 Tax=Ustilago trichophora TaxID=86804 RepID=A0A5C3EAC6_9BASI|nr:related to SMP2 protein, involved in plasmid maintenance, respiration and cell proliferation [Ustilago trichophora]